MRYAKIVYNDVVNSDGMALTFYCQGCTHHCPGCFNKDTWNFTGGKEFTDKELSEMRYALSNYPYDNIVLLGGEPFDNIPMAMKIIELAQEFNKKVWCYTGYTIDQIIDKGNWNLSSSYLNMLSCIDVLIDGEFREELKNPKLKFRGSSNQKIYNARATVSTGTIVELEEYMK